RRQRPRDIPYEPPGNMSCEAAAVVARAFAFAAYRRDTLLQTMHLWAAIAAEPSAARSLWFGTHRQPDERAETRIGRQRLRGGGCRMREPGLVRRGVTCFFRRRRARC